MNKTEQHTKRAFYHIDNGGFGIAMHVEPLTWMDGSRRNEYSVEFLLNTFGQMAKIQITPDPQMLVSMASELVKIASVMTDDPDAMHKNSSFRVFRSFGMYDSISDEPKENQQKYGLIDFMEQVREEVLLGLKNVLGSTTEPSEDDLAKLIEGEGRRRWDAYYTTLPKDDKDDSE